MPASLTLHLPDNWKMALGSEMKADYFTLLMKRIALEYTTQSVYPAQHDLWTAFSATPLSKVKVVILGQDPYHGPRQAHGLAFSVPDNEAMPPSLRNVYKEIKADIGTVTHDSGDLTEWARQGVLLLNSTLTVRAGSPGSHSTLGWERFTDTIIKKISIEQTNVVFILWGAHAVAKQPLIDSAKHLILTAPHPSPLSAYRGFFGCRHFSQANSFLTNHGHPAIDW